MIQEFLKEILISREVRGILRFQCRLYTAYIGNYQVPYFNPLSKVFQVFNVLCFFWQYIPYFWSKV